jgi:hypothetical protein
VENEREQASDQKRCYGNGDCGFPLRGVIVKAGTILGTQKRKWAQLSLVKVVQYP